MSIEMLRSNIKRAMWHLLISVMLLVSVGRLCAGDPIYVVDNDGNGSEVVNLSGAQSVDPDGAIIDFQWLVNNVVVASYFGPRISDFQYTFSLGTTTVSLVVRDDVQVSNSDVVNVIVRPQGSNLPPVAGASVPLIGNIDVTGVATIFVDASSSSDPENDVIHRYRWMEGAAVMYDGSSSTATLALEGLGLHTIRLTVYSTDNQGITQFDVKDFAINIFPPNGERLAGKIFNKELGSDFAFSNIYEDYAGITFNPFTRTYYMVENQEDVIIEMQEDGTLIRTINIHELRKTGALEADAEGITWMYGQTYALVMEGGEEMAILDITPASSAFSRNQVEIHDLSGDPKGVSYNPLDDAIYWVSQSGPKRVIKTQIDPATRELKTISNTIVENLPIVDLADIAFFPRLTPYALLIGQNTPIILEVDLSGTQPVLKSSFSLSGWNIPKPGGLVFGANAKILIVGKHVAGTAEDDLSIFTATSTIPNKAPIANLVGPDIVPDLNGSKDELVIFKGEGSVDVDGSIIDYTWKVNDVIVASGYGPKVLPLNYTFALGTSTVSLLIRDDSQIVSQTSSVVTVIDTFPSGQHPSEPFRQPDDFPRQSINYVHRNALVQQAEIFVDLKTEGAIRIHIYDSLGQEVREIVTTAFVAGAYRIPWDLRNASGSKVSSGVYYVLIKTPSETKREKFVVMRNG
ncbi:MAG: SdiA-regulated domain-containing protein [Elusimicrobiota bacterium]